MTFDMRLLWLIGALGALCLGILILLVKTRYPDHLAHVMSIWGAAHIVLGISCLIRLGRPWETPFVFHVISSTLVISGMSIECWAIRELKNAPTSRFVLIGPPLLTLVTGFWFVSVQRNVTIQLLIFDFISAALMILIARSLFQTEEGHRPFADSVAACAFSLMAITSCAVIVDYFRDGHFRPEYDFNQPRAFMNGVVAILLEEIVYALFLLMVSERLNRNLVIQAMCDSLTGLYNRRAFEEISFREISGASRSGLGLSLLLFDIDHFKRINDKFGHVAGDTVIQTVATTLRHSLRDEDFLCRYGGDEFCALLPRAQREHAENVAERVLQTFRELDFRLEGKAVEISVSIGITTDETCTMDLSSLITQADKALYRSKKAGRKGFSFASEFAAESAYESESLQTV